MNVHATPQEVKEKILLTFIAKVSVSHNCASIVINRDMLPFFPRNYDIRDYIWDKLLYEVQNRGFNYCQSLSDDSQLVFIMQ